MILYVLYKHYKFFSQRSSKSEHGFILGLDINGKCEECVVVKLDNFKGCIQNYSITASAFIREIKITGHLRPKLTINWPTLKILNTANHSEPFVLKRIYNLTILQACRLRNISMNKYSCYPIFIHSDMFYYISICDDKCECTVTNNATVHPSKEKDETHTASLYSTLKLFSG